MNRTIVSLALATLLTVVVMPLSIVGGADLPDGVRVGDQAPEFRLKNVDGSFVTLAQTFGNQKGAIVVFTCNHCPYSVKYEDRIMNLHETFGPQGYPVVAINPNDPAVQPEDSFEGMVERAKEKGFKFPYVFDEAQTTALAYGARRTPHVFVLSKQKKGFVVEYIGAIDDNPNDAAAVGVAHVSNAVRALLSGDKVETTFTKAIGCTIKWKKL
jgi:peroxiredoxin